MVNGTVRTAKILEIFFISPAAGLPSILACYTDEKLDVRELENRSNKVSIMQNQVRQREKEKGGEGEGELFNLKYVGFLKSTSIQLGF